jgi:hypothetical protein
MVRFRFDKVAIRMIERLQANLADAVPAGIAVVVTIAAPIRLASKTTVSVEEQVRTLLQRGATERDKRLTIHGNHVGIRFVRHASPQASKIIGFVHNPDTNPLRMFRGASIEELSLASRLRSKAR